MGGAGWGGWLLAPPPPLGKGAGWPPRRTAARHPPGRVELDEPHIVAALDLLVEVGVGQRDHRRARVEAVAAAAAASAASSAASSAAARAAAAAAGGRSLLACGRERPAAAELELAASCRLCGRRPLVRGAALAPGGRPAGLVAS
jgi:hypothetical protein